MVCYVCLEECDQHSPCKCKAEIHQSCLIQMQVEMPHKNCTICHMPLNMKFKNPDSINEAKWDLISSVLWVSFVFVFYVLAGWLGKFFAWFLGWITVYSFEFWSLEHFVSFMFVAGAIRMLSPSRLIEVDE